MAVLVPTGFGVAALVFNAAGITEPILTTFGIEASDTSDPSGLAETIYTAWTTGTAPYGAASMITGWTFAGVQVSLGPPPDPIQGQHMVSIAGTQTGQSLPVNCAFLVRKNTARGGRKGRGRMYLPPTRGGEDQVNIAGVLDSGLVTGLNTGLNAAHFTMAGDGVGMFLLHEDGSTPDAVTSLSAQSLLATQRRRLR